MMCVRMCRWGLEWAELAVASNIDTTKCIESTVRS